MNPSQASPDKAHNAWVGMLPELGEIVMECQTHQLIMSYLFVEGPGTHHSLLLYGPGS